MFLLMYSNKAFTGVGRMTVRKSITYSIQDLNVNWLLLGNTIFSDVPAC